MQPTYSDYYGWTVPCGCDGGREHYHTAQTYLGGTRDCDDCGGRGFHEITDEEAEELLAPSAPVVLPAEREAALQEMLAKINAAFGRVAA